MNDEALAIWPMLAKHRTLGRQDIKITNQGRDGQIPTNPWQLSPSSKFFFGPLPEHAGCNKTFVRLPKPPLSPPTNVIGSSPASGTDALEQRFILPMRFATNVDQYFLDESSEHGIKLAKQL